MASNHILTLFVLLFSSWFFVGLCEIKHDTLAQGGSTEGNDAAAACVSKLIPCQAYLNATSKPPAECCVPLKEAIANEIECLCKLFANRDLLRDMNVTQEQVLKLPKACGAHAKLSVCKTEAAPPASPPASPPKNSSSNNSTTTKSAAYGVSHFGGSGLATFFVAVIISALQA